MRAVASPLAAVLVAAAVGCASASTSSQIAENLAASAPGCTVARDEAVVMGRLSLAFVRGIVSMAGEDVDEEAREVLDNLRRVETTTFSITPGCTSVASAPVLRERLVSQGWHQAVSTAATDDGMSWVFTREGRGGAISGLLVVVVERDELEVVRLDGQIESVLAAAVAERPATVRGVLDSGS